MTNKNMYVGNNGYMTQSQYKEQLMDYCTYASDSVAIESYLRLSRENLISDSDYVFLRDHSENNNIKQMVRDICDNIAVSELITSELETVVNE